MRIIDADALKTIKSIQSADFNSIETIRQWIDSAPSIDLVRCGECRHCESYAVDTGEDYMTGLWCGLNQKDCMIDDFCSYGNSSEKPNNSTISKMEQVETMSCAEEPCHYEPQTDVYDYKGNGKWERSE